MSEFECITCDRTFESNIARGQHFGKGHSEDERKEALIDEIHRVAEIIGQTPSVSRMKEYGRVGRDAFETAFGSWSNAIEAAGLSEATNVHHTRNELVDKLQRVADQLGHSPTRTEARELLEISTTCFEHRFGSWNDALRDAELPINEPHNLTKEELFEELLRLKYELGRPPTRDEMREMGQFDAKPYRRVFGSWNEALREGGFDLHQVKDATDDDMIEDILDVAETVGGTPTVEQITEHGRFSKTTHQDRFGSWDEAVQEAGLEPNYTPPTRTSITVEETGNTVKSGWEEEIDLLLHESGINYDYEPKRFDLNTRQYTPDFIVGDNVIEVKGWVDERANARASEFLLTRPQYTYIVVGTEMPCDTHIPWEERETLVDYL